MCLNSVNAIAEDAGKARQRLAHSLTGTARQRLARVLVLTVSSALNPWRLLLQNVSDHNAEVLAIASLLLCLGCLLPSRSSPLGFRV